MKFGREWKQCVEQLPFDLKKQSMNYKKWKKVTVDYSDYFLKEIQKEVKRIDDIYQYQLTLLRIYNGKCDRFGIIPLVIKTIRLKPYKPEDLLKFILLNRKAIRKICKRVDKKAHLKDLFCYWYEHVAKPKYSFLTNTLDFTYLNFIITNKVEVCPICLDDGHHKFVILKCGHTMCLECLGTFTHQCLQSSNGTTENLLHNYQYHHKQESICPLCRTHMPFDRFYMCEKIETEE